MREVRTMGRRKEHVWSREALSVEGSLGQACLLGFWVSGGSILAKVF